ncbi:MAG: histidinol-phosphatase [Planctomycetota bacterium]|jgi:histidinol phosphatase-like enzyme (inositol monophosphatase family)
MNDLLEFAVDACEAAGAATLRYFRDEALEVETKADGTPVTRADRDAETILRARIRAAFPADGIVGEEFGEEEGTSGRRWILDPVDGTKSFTRGVPFFGTLLGLEEQGRATLGVVALPALDETVYAARGKGAWWRRAGRLRRARVSAVHRLDEALLCTTSRGGFVRAGERALYRRLQEAVRLDRGWGDCYGHVLVATGRADVMVDPRLAVWDCAPLPPILEEAGGVFMDLAGRATHRGGSGISTNPVLAEALRSFLAEHGTG